MNRILFLVLIMIGTGCKKFLDEKPDQKLVTPTQIEALQALLDNELVINQRNPRAAEMSADDYYLEQSNWAELNEFDKRMYVWDKHHLFPSGSNSDWGNAYMNVSTANVVLTNIDKIDRAPGDEDDWSNAKGHALFLRAQAFLQVAFIWAQAYEEATALTDPGIPLRFDPDLSVRTTRATMKQTYEQIINDLKMAAALLPDMPKHMVRPSKAGAYALLARTYLSMRKYAEMGEYAERSLKIKNSLKDLNSLREQPSTSFPFAPRFSNEEEIITEFSMMHTPAMNLMAARIDSNLYGSFSENDLRKKMFFRSNSNATFGFRGNYSGSAALFSGLATNEVYLMRAEHYARMGNTSAAMADLNMLLERRFVTNTFVPLAAGTPNAALRLILAERRKELIMRGLRWMDIKRLNKEGENIILKRVVDKKIYVLPPNDPRYAMPIPDDVIKQTGMEQNPS